MHDDLTRPKGSMVVVVTLKSKMASGSTSSGGNSKSAGSIVVYRGSELAEKMRWILIIFEVE